MSRWTRINVDVDIHVHGALRREAAKEIGKLTIIGNVLSKEEKKDRGRDRKDMDVKADAASEVRRGRDKHTQFRVRSKRNARAYSIGFVAPLPLSRAKLQEGAPSNVS